MSSREGCLQAEKPFDQENMQVNMELIFSILGAALLGIVGFVATDFKSRMERGVNKLADSFEKQLGSTRNLLRQHSADMGHCTKAINGDMLKIKDDILNFKNELFDQIQDLKKEFTDIERKNEILATRMEMSTDKYNARSTDIKNTIDLIKSYEHQVKHVRQSQNELFSKIESFNIDGLDKITTTDTRKIEYEFEDVEDTIIVNEDGTIK